MTSCQIDTTYLSYVGLLYVVSVFDILYVRCFVLVYWISFNLKNADGQICMNVLVFCKCTKFPASVDPMCVKYVRWWCVDCRCCCCCCWPGLALHTPTDVSGGKKRASGSRQLALLTPHLTSKWQQHHRVDVVQNQVCYFKTRPCEKASA